MDFSDNWFQIYRSSIFTKLVLIQGKAEFLIFLNGCVYMKRSYLYHANIGIGPGIQSFFIIHHSRNGSIKGQILCSVPGLSIQMWEGEILIYRPLSSSTTVLKRVLQPKLYLMAGIASISPFTEDDERICEVADPLSPLQPLVLSHERSLRGESSQVVQWVGMISSRCTLAQQNNTSSISRGFSILTEEGEYLVLSIY